MSKTPQSVPGGLSGIVAAASLPGSLKNLFEQFLIKGNTSVTATTELAAPATSIFIDLSSLSTESGTLLSLPVKVKLNNPFLGNECYIGSNAHPIILELTVGTTSPPAPNKPIKGSKGIYFGRGSGEIIVLSKALLVNNSFAVPGATGCGGTLSAVVDPAIDAEIGLPSAAGHNTAILNSTMELVSAEAVRKYG